MNYLTYISSEADEGVQVLDIMKNHFGLSARKIKSAKFADNGILLEGHKVTVRTKLLPGQTLKILLDDSDKKQNKINPVKMPLNIIYEDAYFLVVNKPAGIVCHPSQGHYFDSLANGICYYLTSKNEPAFVHICGRLDKETSGLVLFAKNSVAELAVNKLKSAGNFKKTYIAICEGTFPQRKGTIEIPMMEYRDEAGILRMIRAVDKYEYSDRVITARTDYEVISKSLLEMDTECKNYTKSDMNAQECSVVKVSIATGRMHQIRYHMSEIGHPLLGDNMYGHGPGILIGRTALHALRIEFVHPFTGKNILLEAPIPDDMKKLMNFYDVL